MSRDWRAFDEHVQQRAEPYLADLVDLCRQPSVSSSGEGIQPMAARVAELFSRAGAEVEVLAAENAPYPAVLGTFGHGPYTLLLYDHYDVQPVEPLDAWHTAPFEPLLRDGVLYGRGVADDKGELLARVQALTAYQAVFGELPIQVKLLAEGAHEIGSRGLEQIVTAHRDTLRADACVSEGLGRDEQDNLTVHLGCRGFAYLELVVQQRDQVHASMFGGLLPNPGWRLVQALSTLADANGDLTLDGLDAHVPAPSAEDLTMLARLPLDEARLLASLQTREFAAGRSGLPLLQRYLLEPYWTITALQSGDPEWGLKLPGRAVARLDLRLVPNLNPRLVTDLLRAHLEHRGFADVQVRLLSGVAPDRCPSNAPIARAAVDAARDLSGLEPAVYPIMPAYSASDVFHRILGTPVIFAGAVTHAASNLHAANENIRVTDYLAAIKYLGRLIQRLSAIAPSA